MSLRDKLNEHELIVWFTIGFFSAIFIMLITLFQFKVVDYIKIPVHPTDSMAHEYLYENKLKIFKE